MSPRIRLASAADIPAIEALTARSGRELSRGFYTPEQAESLVRHVFGADADLVSDGTCFVAEADGQIVAAGAWSRRRTLHGGAPVEDDDGTPLDPDREPARIRAFFVHPDHARQGLGRRIYAECETWARAAGFRSFVLMATLSGEPLYKALGFSAVERHRLRLPDGLEVDFIEMRRDIA